VRGARSESPLRGVVIAANGHSTTTGRDGTYLLALSRGTYTVTATKIGYTPESCSRRWSATFQPR
jgi:hypothetical protein